MAQESSDDINSKFSTLNINAMEFVPSFGADPEDEDESPVSAQAPAVVVPESVPVAATNSTTNNSGMYVCLSVGHPTNQSCNNPLRSSPKRFTPDHSRYIGYCIVPDFQIRWTAGTRTPLLHRRRRTWT